MLDQFEEMVKCQKAQACSSGKDEINIEVQELIGFYQEISSRAEIVDPLDRDVYHFDYDSNEWILQNITNKDLKQKISDLKPI